MQPKARQKKVRAMHYRPHYVFSTEEHVKLVMVPRELIISS